ncbi:unnamed protein product [Diatraea saccharalis]|uniref:C2H2-type domain-containing protein n=1 Tax=Diatraea saccharalis TaxID=40085 RepID=A0A9N9R707_9NEOP|nr:unnamed protein product [Diatraea saccharalis]
MLQLLLIILNCIIIGISTSFDSRLNVGTVLFSPSDHQKLYWNATELSLLKARRYFQDLLPPANFIETANEAYVNKLLRYFRDTYCTIKNETPNETVNYVMTTAFSDAVGGYLKFWILPVTKFGFYGGTVSQNNIIKLSRFYKDLKNFLHTDGVGWRGPDVNFLHNTTMYTAPPRHFRKAIRNPCKALLFEDNPYESIIPIPKVNWNEKSSSMFIPLKKYSIVPLDSPDYPNALIKYYDIAKNCIEENNPTRSDDFEKRFQAWLVKEVMPHLYDEKIYFGLGSVLTLVNKTQKIDFISYDRKTHKVIIGGFPIDLTAKKTLLILIILILEIAWCIPALIYLICTKKMKPLCFQGSKSEGSNECTKTRTTTTTTTNAVSIFLDKPQADMIRFEPRHIQSKSSVPMKAGISYEREVKNLPSKSSLKKICNTSSSHSQKKVPITMEKSKSSILSRKICCCSKCPISGSLHNTKSVYSEKDAIIAINKSYDSNKKSVKKLCSCSKCTIYGSLRKTASFYSENDTIVAINKSTESNTKSVRETISRVTYVKCESNNTLQNIQLKCSTDQISIKESNQNLDKCACHDCLQDEKSNKNLIYDICVKDTNSHLSLEKNCSCRSCLKDNNSEESLERHCSCRSCLKDISSNQSLENHCSCHDCIKDNKSDRNIEKTVCLCQSCLEDTNSDQNLDKYLPCQSSKNSCHTHFDDKKDSQVTILTQEILSSELVNIKKFDTSMQAQQPLEIDNVYKDIGLTIESMNHPGLEIMIENPHTEISVCVGKGNFDKKYTLKPSKIPKRLPNADYRATHQPSTKKEVVRIANTNRSLIPKRKITIVDDLAIDQRKSVHKVKNNKLNVTL